MLYSVLLQQYVFNQPVSASKKKTQKKKQKQKPIQTLWTYIEGLKSEVL